jgi:hypothetical protein
LSQWRLGGHVGDGGDAGLVSADRGGGPAARGVYAVLGLEMGELEKGEWVNGCQGWRGQGMGTGEGWG